jgi:hypothetical protein
VIRAAGRGEKATGTDAISCNGRSLIRVRYIHDGLASYSMRLTKERHTKVNQTIIDSHSSQTNPSSHRT